MKVISTNLGKKQKIQWQGKQEYTGMYKYPVLEPLELGFTDVDKDSVIDRRYHGGIDKACYLYSADHYAFWKSQYPDIEWDWGMFGENLTIKGLNESQIRIGEIFKLGSSKVQVTQPRQPCYKLGIRLNNNNAVKNFVKQEMPGVYLRVIEEGVVSKNDEMVKIEDREHNFSVREIYHLLYHAKTNLEKIEQAIRMPELAESCRNDLIKYSRR